VLGGEVEEDRAEERLRDADAAQNEVLPTCLETGRRSIQGHQKHGGERRGLHGYPQQAHVVGGKRHQHGGDEELIHAVVEPQLRCAHAPVLHLHPHVGAREDGRGEAHERRERHEEDVEGVDEELIVREGQGARAHHVYGEGAGGEEGHQAEGDIELRCRAPRAERGEHGGTRERTSQQE